MVLLYLKVPYLPLPLAAVISGQPVSMALAAALAFAVPFTGTLLARKGG